MTGKELKELISELGITQQSIADSCNVSRITLLKWLNRDELAADVESRIKWAVICEIDAKIFNLRDELSTISTKIERLHKLQERLRK